MSIVAPLLSAPPSIITIFGKQYLLIIHANSNTIFLVFSSSTGDSSNTTSLHCNKILPFNGKFDKFSLWITQLNALLGSCQWKGIFSNIVTTPSNTKTQHALCVALLMCLKNNPLLLFKKNIAYKGKGFKMCLCLIKKYQSTGVEALFDILLQLFTFK